MLQAMRGSRGSTMKHYSRLALRTRARQHTRRPHARLLHHRRPVRVRGARVARAAYGSRRLLPAGPGRRIHHSLQSHWLGGLGRGQHRFASNRGDDGRLGLGVGSGEARSASPPAHAASRRAHQITSGQWPVRATPGGALNAGSRRTISAAASLTLASGADRLRDVLQSWCGIIRTTVMCSRVVPPVSAGLFPCAGTRRLRYARPHRASAASPVHRHCRRAAR